MGSRGTLISCLCFLQNSPLVLSFLGIFSLISQNHRWDFQGYLAFIHLISTSLFSPPPYSHSIPVRQAFLRLCGLRSSENILYRAHVCPIIILELIQQKDRFVILKKSHAQKLICSISIKKDEELSVFYEILNSPFI